jgi:restriction system protein
VITIDVRHDGLGRFRRVCAPGRQLAEQRAAALERLWEEQWRRRQAALRRPGAAEALKKLEAEEATAEAERRAGALTSILLTALHQPAVADLAPLYDNAAFDEAPPAEPAALKLEPEPRKSQFKAAPLTLVTLLNPAAMRRRKEAVQTKFKTAHDGWQYLARWREGEYEKAVSAYQALRRDWEQRRSLFHEKQARANSRLDTLRQDEGEAVVGRSDLALLSLERPEGFPHFWTIGYAQGTLTIDYDLPSMEQVPLVKGVKYAAGRQAFETVLLADGERERLYGEAVFQTTLAVLHTLFASDAAEAIKAVVFNGWTNFIDGARPGRACILAVTVDKRSFAAFDLSGIDPRGCFCALNGSMSPKLAALAACRAA